MTQNSQTRNAGYDVLKIVATFSVVFQHVLGFHIEGGDAVIYYACSFAIPIFFMVNGALILNRESVTISYAGNKIFRLLLLAFLWNSIYAICHIVKTGEGISPLILTMQSLKQIGFFSVFWFLGALCIIYSTLPFWYEKYKNPLYARKIVVILCLSLIIVDILSLWKSNDQIASFQMMIPQIERIWTWFAYFCLGAYLSKAEIKSWITARISLKFNSILIIIFTIIVVGWDMYVSHNIYHYYFLEYFYVNIFTILWSISIFCFFDRLDVTAGTMIRILSKCTLGIYIIHWALLRVTWDMLSSVTGCHIPYCVIYSLASLGLVYLCSNIPIVNRLFRL